MEHAQNGNKQTTPSSRYNAHTTERARSSRVNPATARKNGEEEIWAPDWIVTVATRAVGGEKTRVRERVDR